MNTKIEKRELVKVKKDDCCGEFSRKESGGYDRCLVCTHVIVEWGGIYCHLRWAMTRAK